MTLIPWRDRFFSNSFLDKMFNNRDIADYYDQTEVHYRRFWKLRNHYAIHYGIWGNGIRTFGQALDNTNRLLAEKAGIQSSYLVLDAGCGIGSSAFFLARNFGCRVIGISLSQKQIKRAERISQTLSLNHLLQFEVKDFNNTGYPVNRFDVIWALESVGSAPDKKAFLKEAYRLLKPKGILILADYFKLPDIPASDQPLLDSWLKLWAITDLETIGSFRTLAEKSGFQIQDIEDYTREIAPSSRRMYLASCLGVTSSLLYNLFHKNTSRFAKHHYKSGFLQYRALKKKLWEYKVILARKGVKSDE